MSGQRGINGIFVGFTLCKAARFRLESPIWSLVCYEGLVEGFVAPLSLPTTPIHCMTDRATSGASS